MLWQLGENKLEMFCVSVRGVDGFIPLCVVPIDYQSRWQVRERGCQVSVLLPVHVSCQVPIYICAHFTKLVLTLVKTLH